VLKIPPLPSVKKRTGFFISVSGTRLKNMFEPSLVIVKTWFHVINVDYVGELLVSGVDGKGEILNRPDVMKQAFDWGQKLAASAAE
jgi:hypothetical protein